MGEVRKWFFIFLIFIVGNLRCLHNFFKKHFSCQGSTVVNDSGMKERKRRKRLAR